jgi:membrane protease YdiL (CAAX protease family)
MSTAGIAVGEMKRRRIGTTLAVLALLIGSNLVTNLLIADWVSVPWNVAIAALVVLLARRAVTLEEMGFQHWRSGAAWGGVLFACTAVLLSIAILFPVFDEVFRDRNAGESAVTWFLIAFIRIPFGTALLEEVAFRGALPALYARRWGVTAGSVIASVWFGAWHLLPALDVGKANPTAERWLGPGALGTSVGVASAVIGTFLAGLWWCFVRYRSKSLLSSFLGHVAANAVAYTIAFAVSS